MTKTLGCQTICWTQARARVIRTDQTRTYVIVAVGQDEHRIHIDYVQRTDPGATRKQRAKNATTRKSMPDGLSDQTL
ncbi:hypothetical protein HH310_24185 [Actinoplanes sp. TBRC 11911]|uniref:hypothetical protein n=1 Tax=Actinoplanes sp. TBRC 11911 TaxID=2729386 RepID=UPI00145CC3B5|nr:hypothetical protein [Actinoplanes sp. TBRC 11911]NMO54270.1 hypothetical protein [Actinoplanes sp. TBRC 11911]